MSIVLRKLNGRFDAALAATRKGGPTYSNIASPTRAFAGMLGMLGMFAVIVLAVIALLTLSRGLGGHASSVIALHGPASFAVAGTSAALKQVQDELAAKQQKLHEVFEAAGNEMDVAKEPVLKLLGASDSKTAVEKIRAMNAELEDLGKKRDEMVEVERIREVNAKRRSEPANVIEFPNPEDREQREKDKKSRSLGRIIVESQAFQSFRKNKQAIDSVEDVAPDGVKAAFTTSAGWSPQTLRIPGLVIEKATRPIQVLDIIPTGPTAQAAVVYMEETTRTQSEAERAENATYAEDAFALTQRSISVRAIGSSVPVTDEQLEDVDQVEAYLNQRLSFGVNQRLDGQIINGDGNAPNISGILAATGLQTQAKGTDPSQDAFYKAMVNVRVTGRAVPSAHIIHPTDWQNIRLQRTADGIYLWGSPAEAGPERLWGLMVAQADSIAQGNGITGDFVTFIQLWIRRGVEIAVGYNSTDFINGRKTIRAGMRVALAVYRGAAFCEVTGL